MVSAGPEESVSLTESLKESGWLTVAELVRSTEAETLRMRAAAVADDRR
jgi:hypothetical protein